MTPPADQNAEQSKSPEEIREEIDQTREQLGDTVEALAEKSDAKAQAKQRLAGVKDNVQQKRDQYVSTAKQSTPDSASAGAHQIAVTIRQKPVPFSAAGAFAVGLVIGRRLGR